MPTYDFLSHPRIHFAHLSKNVIINVIFHENSPFRAFCPLLPTLPRKSGLLIYIYKFTIVKLHILIEKGGKSGHLGIKVGRSPIFDPKYPILTQKQETRISPSLLRKYDFTLAVVLQIADQEHNEPQSARTNGQQDIQPNPLFLHLTVLLSKYPRF